MSEKNNKITEKDAEEQENKRKQRQSRIISIIIAVAIIAIGAYVMYLGFTSGNFFIIIFGFILFSFSTSLLNVGARSAPPLLAKINTLTVIKCYNCEYTEIREFAKGDYIFKELEPCKDCSGNKFIKTIYTVKPENEKE